MVRWALISLAVPMVSGCIPLDFGEFVLDVPVDSEPEDTAAALANEVFVPMEGLAFTEPEVTVPVGGTVTWTNSDTAFHIIKEGTPDDPGEWGSPEILFGDSWSSIFEEPGDFIYFCDNHSRTMKDAIIHVVEP